jgi:hypothetical protein
MNYLIQEFGLGITILILIIGTAISLYILFLVIKAAVRSAMGDSNFYSKENNKELTLIRKELERSGDSKK